MTKSSAIITFIGILIGILGIVVSVFLSLFNNISWEIITIVLGLTMFLLIIIGILMKTERLEQENNTLKKELKSGTQRLWEHYGELSRFERQKRMKEFLNTFIRGNQYVCGIQLYEYSIQNTVGSNSVVKVNYVDGAVGEGEELNAIGQSYYKFKKNELSQLKKSIKYIENDPVDVEHILKFIEKNRQSILKVQYDDLKDKDALTLSLVDLAIAYLEKRFNFNTTELLPEKISNRLHQMKRVGIACVIIKYEILNDSSFYSFSYRGVYDKKSNRKYISYIIKSALGEKFLYLITTKPDEEWDKFKEIQELNNISKNFKNSLLKSGLIYDKMKIESEGGE